MCAGGRLVALVGLGAGLAVLVGAGAGVAGVADGAGGAGGHPGHGRAASVDPLRTFEARGREVVVDASGVVRFDGAALENVDGRGGGGGRGAGGPAVGAVAFGDRLVVAHRDGVVVVYDLPAPETDGAPAFVQRIASLGRDLVDIDVVAEPPRVLVLAAGSTEIFGLRFHDAADLDAGLVDDPAYVDHARYMEYVRDAGAQDDAGGAGGAGGDSGGSGGLGAIDTPRLFAVGPQSLALVTQRHVLELFHLDRSYRELSRTPTPEGVARIDAIAHTGSAWVLAGLGPTGEPVLMASATLAGPWHDLGVDVLDAALADALGEGGEPVAWLPGRLTVTDREARLTIRGERPAVASWPLSADALDAGMVGVVGVAVVGVGDDATK